MKLCCIKYINVVVGLLLFLFSACRDHISVNIPELSDGDPTTYYTRAQGVNKIVFDTQSSIPIQSYKLYSSGKAPAHDPVGWVLKGIFGKDSNIEGIWNEYQAFIEK